jgi:GNAT superfamily N-acetyltransferase
MIAIRDALLEDAPAIRAIKDVVWPDDATSEGYIVKVMAQSDHHTTLALVDNVPAGWVSGFMTAARDGQCRWEVDLLAVHPEFRGQGIAPRLIEVSVQAGRARGAEVARALIHVENRASQGAFARCGFALSEPTCGLYISADAPSTPPEHASRDDLHLISVCTLNYRGVWLEGALDAAGFRLAQAVRTRYGWDVAGAVIVHSAALVTEAAQSCGYDLVGDYAWWTLWQ